MADLYEPDVGTAYYRSSDPVKNLKISVTLDRITSSALIPTIGNVTQRSAGDDVELKDFTKQGVKDREEIVVSWQQKIFSVSEVLKYKYEANCTTPVDLKYHQEVKDIDEKKLNRIFTYVDHDEFSLDEKPTEFLTSSPNEQPSYLAQNMAQVRRRRIGAGGKQRRDNNLRADLLSKDELKILQRNADPDQGGPDSGPDCLHCTTVHFMDSSFVPKLNVIEDEPTEELVTRNHLIATPVQVMHIMADLRPRDRMSKEGDVVVEEEEVVLCTIQVDASGVMSIHPDFNRGRKAYIKESQKEFGREVFEYTLEHGSKEMNRQEQDREMKMYREVYTRHKDFLQACVGTDFEIPPVNVLRLLVYGEIESVKDFEYDDLYLHFFIDLPKYWTSERHQQLSWVTQTCSTKVVGREDVAYFSFPFHFELFYRNDNLDEEAKELELPKFPSIMIEVLSLDSWNRFRTEGYTYLTVPGQPGQHKETVHCWRPTGSTVISRLRRFFIGGSPELEDPTYPGIPSTFQGSHLSKFGFRTETTGSVNVNLNVIMQSRAFRDKKASKQTLSSLLESLGINHVQQNISNVLDAFKKARNRMLQARENASKDLMKTSTKPALA